MAIASMEWVCVGRIINFWIDLRSRAFYRLRGLNKYLRQLEYFLSQDEKIDVSATITMDPGPLSSEARGSSEKFAL